MSMTNVYDLPEYEIAVETINLLNLYENIIKRALDYYILSEKRTKKEISQAKEAKDGLSNLVKTIQESEGQI